MTAKFLSRVLAAVAKRFGHSAHATTAAPRRLLLLVTADRSVSFFYGFASFMVRHGWEVHIAASPGPNLQNIAQAEGVVPHALPMSRAISLKQDVASLVRAVQLVIRVKPSIVCAGTPKAGLIGMLASVFIPSARRVYQLHGLRLETASGLTRRILTASERVACRIAHAVLVVSDDLRKQCMSLRLAPESKLVVAGSGSANGVDVPRFAGAPAAPVPGGAPAYTSPVLGFVGRINEDKGIPLLAASLSELARRGVRGTLLLVGPDDSPNSAALRRSLDDSTWTVYHFGLVRDIERYYAAMDLVCLPTLREGFPTTILEAGAAGKPVIATSATGVGDAIVHGETGMIVQSRDPHVYATAIQRLLSSPKKMNELGNAAFERVNKLYRREVVWQAYRDFYDDELTRVGCRVR